MLKFFPPTPQEKLGRFAQIPSVIQILLEITNKKKKNMENFNFMFLTLIWKKSRQGVPKCKAVISKFTLTLILRTLDKMFWSLPARRRDQ